MSRQFLEWKKCYLWGATGILSLKNTPNSKHKATQTLLRLKALKVAFVFKAVVIQSWKLSEVITWDYFSLNYLERQLEIKWNFGNHCHNSHKSQVTKWCAALEKRQITHFRNLPIINLNIHTNPISTKTRYTCIFSSHDFAFFILAFWATASCDDITVSLAFLKCAWNHSFFLC